MYDINVPNNPLSLKFVFHFFAILFFCSLSGQAVSRLDSLKLAEVNDFFADDYGNIYLYKNKDFSFTKYDSVGKQKGKLMFTVPNKIQSVQNPFNIPSFSENAQTLQFFDQNLVLVQTINLREKFGFIKSAYSEDLQQIWLLEESSKRLIQYNFRNDLQINSYPFTFDTDEVKDILVYGNLLYLLTKQGVSVYNFRSEKQMDFTITDGRKFRREGNKVFVLTPKSILQINMSGLETLFSREDSKIVDKNSTAYFVIIGNKLYLYPVRKSSYK